MNYRKYLIISIDEIDKVNISELCDSSIDSLRKSLDGKKVLLRWWTTDSACWHPTPEQIQYANNLDLESFEEETLLPPPDPYFIQTLENKEGPFTQDEILGILSTSEWTIDISRI
jgi:hypothetical protein